MKRKTFLNEFLSALGAAKILYTSETNDQISGTVIYDINNIDEAQDFLWKVKEEQTPSEKVLKLAKLLNDERLLNIDLITISRDNLLQKYNYKYRCKFTPDEFAIILEELETIKVNMVDDGEETDFFFIHE